MSENILMLKMSGICLNRINLWLIMMTHGLNSMHGRIKEAIVHYILDFALLTFNLESYALFNTHLSDLQKIRLTKKDLSYTVLHKAGHAVLDGLLPQFLHPGSDLYLVLHFRCSYKDLMKTRTSFVTRIVAL